MDRQSEKWIEYQAEIFVRDNLIEAGLENEVVVTGRKCYKSPDADLYENICKVLVEYTEKYGTIMEYLQLLEEINDIPIEIIKTADIVEP